MNEGVFIILRILFSEKLGIGKFERKSFIRMIGTGSKRFAEYEVSFGADFV